MPDSLQPHGLQPARLLCPQKSPGKTTRVGWHSLLQGFFPTQRWNPGLPHCSQILNHLSHQGSPNLILCLIYMLNFTVCTGNVYVYVYRKNSMCRVWCNVVSGIQWGSQKGVLLQFELFNRISGTQRTCVLCISPSFNKFLPFSGLDIFFLCFILEVLLFQIVHLN